jgi:hypothetical protein
MKYLCSAAVCILLCGSVHAQDVSEQRANIQTRREQESRRFDAQERDCLDKFAVNDCTHAVQVRRRQVIGNLQREENLVKDLERQRSAMAQLKSVEDKAKARQEHEASIRLQENAKKRSAAELAVAKKAAEHAAQARPVVKKPAAQSRGPSRQTATEMENARVFSEKTAENQKRQMERARRLKEKPSTAAPLPVPAQ